MKCTKCGRKVKEYDEAYDIFVIIVSFIHDKLNLNCGQYDSRTCPRFTYYSSEKDNKEILFSFDIPALICVCEIMSKAEELENQLIKAIKNAENIRKEAAEKEEIKETIKKVKNLEDAVREINNKIKGNK